MFYMWLLIIILLTIVELATVNFVTIWFVASGLISLILSFFTDNFLLQVGVFTILGIILLLITRPLVNKLLKKDNIPTNTDRIIGMQGIITEDISPTNYGEVKVDGKRWTAMSNEELPIGSIVKILKIDGVKLEVKKWEE